MKISTSFRMTASNAGSINFARNMSNLVRLLRIAVFKRQNPS